MRELAFCSIMLAAIVLVPVLVVCVECLAALLPRRADRAAPQNRPPIIVVIPAHNEELVIGHTLANVQPMLAPGDRLLVVADNCTDKTAEVAHSFTAEVIERTDPRQIGKGYALDFAARHLTKTIKDDSSAVVTVIDADCTISTGTLDALAEQVDRTLCPAQAIYLMACPANAKPGDLVSTLAFLVRNQVRPRGLHRLGLPCSLTGSGMAFPWKVFRTAPLATPCIVEDLQLGIRLLINGCPPHLCEAARITGILPTDSGDAVAQRTRWEHGHLRLALTEVPHLVMSSLTSLRFAPLAIALDIAVPPLSLLMMTLCIATAAAGIFAYFGGSHWPLLILLCGNLALTLCLTLAWMVFGRSILPLASSVAVPRYILAKVPLYMRFLTRPQTLWVRTPRSSTLPTAAVTTPESHLAAESEHD